MAENGTLARSGELLWAPTPTPFGVCLLRTRPNDEYVQTSSCSDTLPIRVQGVRLSETGVVITRSADWNCGFRTSVLQRIQHTQPSASRHTRSFTALLLPQIILSYSARLRPLTFSLSLQVFSPILNFVYLTLGAGENDFLAPDARGLNSLYPIDFLPLALYDAFASRNPSVEERGSP